MRNLKQKRVALFLCLTGIIVISLFFLIGTVRSSNNKIGISKEKDFFIYPDPNTHDPNEVYNHIKVKIIPYKTFRLGFKLLLDDETNLWIYYAPTSQEDFQEYEGSNIHISLNAALIDSNIHTIERDISLDLESFVVSGLKGIEKVEIVGERFDLYYIIAYRKLVDSSQIKIIIDDFDESDQGLTERGWKSTTSMDQFSISYDSSLIGYLKAKYIPETTPEDPNDTEQPTYPYYVYPPPYGGSILYGGYYGGGGYYGSGYYGGGYYGGSSSYYGSSLYGGYYGGGGYYGSGYYGGGYYGGGYGGFGGYGGLYGGLGGYYGGLYGGGYYGGGLYGGLGGYYGGLYGGLGYGGYGGLYGLSNYYGGPIGLLGGLSGLFI